MTWSRGTGASRPSIGTTRLVHMASSQEYPSGKANLEERMSGDHTVQVNKDYIQVV